MQSASSQLQLHSAPQAGTAWSIAAAAAALHASNPNDSLALDHYARALKALKLTAAAERFLARETARNQSNGGGVIPWTSRARRFAANLRALEARTPQGAALLATAASELAQYELHQSVDGNYQVLDLRRPVHAGWLGTLADHKAAVALWNFDRSKPSLPHPVAFDGIGFAWLLLHALQTTERSFLNYSCAFYILEPDPLALAMAFHMHDLQSVIGADRVRWIIAPASDAAVRDFQLALESHPHWSPPAHCFQCALRPRPAMDLAPAVGTITAARNRCRAALLAAISQNYADKSRPHWNQRYEAALGGTGEPLRVLGITSRYTTVLQHSMAELRSAVEASGCKMEIAIEPDDQALENPFIEKIAAFKPDLIVQISRMRYENPHLPREVPFISWDQDNLPCMRTPAATASVREGGLTFVAGQGAYQGYVYLGWPEQNVILCHLAAATHRYQPRLPTAQEVEKYGCDFSYVSNAAASPAALRDQHLARLKGEAGAILGALCERVIADPLDDCHIPWHEESLRAAIRSLAEERRTHLPTELLQDLIQSALLVADRAFRHQTLQWIADYCKDAGKSLRLYGAGWENHPSLAPYAAGPAQPGEQLQAITLATRINLQIIGTGVLHARLLDGLAAGGFFMFRRTHHDHSDPAFLAALDVVSRHVFENKVASFTALDATSDPQIHEAWALIAPYYRDPSRKTSIDETIQLRGIAAAHRLAHPLTLLPALPQAGFASAQEFAQRAAAFLTDDHARHRLAAELRSAIQEHFSYDARWRAFLSQIHASLGAASLRI